MSLFDKVKSKIKEDLIIEMNNKGDDDSLDDKNDKNKNNKNNKRTPPNRNKRFKRTPSSQQAANTASKETQSATSGMDTARDQFVRQDRIQQNLKKNKDSLENTLKQNTQQNTSDRKLDQLKQQEIINKQYDMGGGEVTGTPQDQTYESPSKEKVEKIQKKSIKNQADAGNRAKTFRRSFGTPTGADPKTGKPTYAPSYTVDAKGNKKIGPDLGTGPDKTLPTTRGNTVPTDTTYDKVSKNLGDREAGKSKYIDPKTNKASPEGVKRYITKARQSRSGSDITVDKKTTDVIATSAGDQYREKIDTKYGGRRIKLSQQPIKTQEPQSNARRNMNRTLNFKNFRQKLKNLSSKATEKLSKIKTSLNQKTSNFQKGLKDPSRGFGAYKKGKRAMLGNVARKRGLIGDIALATAIAYPFIQDARARRKNKEEGKPPIERISSKNTTDTGALYSTKTGKDIKFGFNASGKPPQGTVGSMFSKKVKSKVQSKIGTGEYDFRKKVT